MDHAAGAGGRAGTSAEPAVSSTFQSAAGQNDQNRRGKRIVDHSLDGGSFLRSNPFQNKVMPSIT